MGRLLRTVRHLRAGQAFHQARWRLLGPLLRGRAAAARLAAPARRPWPGAWSGPSYLPPRQTAAGMFTMLGETHAVATPADWNDPRRSRLWLYTCHYLDDLANDAPDCRSAAAQLLEDWIAGNPPAAGVGWEPYPLSLRIVNIVKWCARQPDAGAWLPSLVRQARVLEGQLEHHLRGNHLFANAKALVFAGGFCTGPDARRWLRRGASLLREQLREQFLADGAHFERSPMYHALLLWDLCDLIELGACSGVAELGAVAAACRPVLDRGLAWLATLCHPDGDIAFFQDATLGAAPTLAQLRAYADRLAIASAPAAQDGLTVLDPSGYRAVTFGAGTKLLVDVGSVGPACQPGHAHAGTLSLELSIRGQRVVVNSGVSTYAVGPQRGRERGTAAHSTVEVDGRDSSEVWAAFRVGRRARVSDRGQRSSGSTHELWATHDGYAHLPGGPRHTRHCTCRPGGLEIADRLSAPVGGGVARLFLHPAVQVEDPARWLLPDGTRVHVAIRGGTATPRAAAWHPGFGISVPNTCIEIPLAGRDLTTTLTWDA